MEGISVGMFFIGRMILVTVKCPIFFVYYREKYICIKFCMHPCQINTGSLVNNLPVNFTTSNNKKFFYIHRAC